MIAIARCHWCLKSALESPENVFVNEKERENTTRRQKTENCIIHSLTYATLIHIDKVDAENAKKFSALHTCKCILVPAPTYFWDADYFRNRNALK